MGSVLKRRRRRLLPRSDPPPLQVGSTRSTRQPSRLEPNGRRAARSGDCVSRVFKDGLPSDELSLSQSALVTQAEAGSVSRAI